ncbi:MAG: glutamate 5-kinase [Tepidisphaeraceae bacterium]|jgi:glutamate 5-kinase
MANRAEYLAGVRTVVVKLGTQLLSDKDGRLDAAFVAAIAGQLAKLRAAGMRVTIVSSGAIGCGLRELGLAKRPTDLAMLQAVAAVGQRRLMDVWADAFESHQLHVAQLLLTRQDIDDRSRFLNLRNTLVAVHELGGIPIVNENDTVSTAELERISFGDNDILAALVAHALRADLLVLLTVVDGLLDASGKPVRMVNHLDDVRKHIRGEKSPLGRGGMDSKLQAAQMVTDAGEVMVVADGRMPDVFSRLLAGEEIGTMFVPAGKKRSSRSRWIGSLRLSGTLVIDDGARRALVEKNRSLLPAGIVKVEGDFSRGDAIGIAGADGVLIARGLSNYSSADMSRILGLKTQQIRQMLAEAAYDEAIHRDNLVLERANHS